MGRVHGQSCADSPVVSITLVGPHHFSIDIELQVIFKERGCQIDGGGITLEIRCHQDPILIGVTERNTIRHIFQTTAYSHVMVCTNGCLENFFLPVSVCFTEGAWSISFTIKFGYVSFEFIGIHYVYCLLQYTGGNVTFIVHLWFAACFPFLCSDDNHTIRST